MQGGLLSLMIFKGVIMKNFVLFIGILRCISLYGMDPLAESEIASLEENIKNLTAIQILLNTIDTALGDCQNDSFFQTRLVRYKNSHFIEKENIGELTEQDINDIGDNKYLYIRQYKTLNIYDEKPQIVGAIFVGADQNILLKKLLPDYR